MCKQDQTIEPLTPELSRHSQDGRLKNKTKKKNVDVKQYFNVTVFILVHRKFTLPIWRIKLLRILSHESCP